MTGGRVHVGPIERVDAGDEGGAGSVGGIGVEFDELGVCVAEGGGVAGGV
jgi:hypothetical protein